MPEIQKDLVLSPNEYAYVLDETKGNVACNVGPHKMSLSQSDNLVKFDTKTKKFIPCDRYNDAISLFVTAPEGWYIALKNPAPGNKHPQAGTINELHEGYHDIVLNAITDSGVPEYLHEFAENGMRITDVEVLSIEIEGSIQALIDKHQGEIVSRSLALAAAKNSAETEKEIIALNKEKVQLAEDYAQSKAMLEAETRATEFELTVAAQRDKDEEDKRKYEIEKEIQSLKDAIFEAEQLRLQKEREAELEHRRKMFEIESAREAAAADSMKTILEALGPDLAAALTTRSNQAVVEKIAESIAPYAVAGGQPVSRAVSELLRGTTLESVIDTLKKE